MALMVALGPDDRAAARDPRARSWAPPPTSASSAAATSPSTTTARWWTAARKVPRVLGAAPAVYGKGLMTAAGGSAVATLKGVVPADERTVTDLAAQVEEGQLDALDAAAARRPAAHPPRPRPREHASGSGSGDVVTVTSPQGRLSPDGHAAERHEVPGGGHRAQRPLRVRRRLGLHPAGRRPSASSPRSDARRWWRCASTTSTRCEAVRRRASAPRWARAT